METFLPLRELIGRERSLRGVTLALHLAVTDVIPPAVGALHVTCADETEHECAAAFRRGFVQYTLPSLKSSQQAAMRIANLGGRHEWGSLGIAEEHYASATSRRAWKLMVVQVNAHVGRQRTSLGVRYGWLDRYDSESTCCGALAALLRGSALPAVDELRTLFASEGLDRMALLLDETRVPRARRALDAALVSARLQARSAILEIQDLKPSTPTLWLVLPCVTVNQAGPDAEIVVGLYVADQRAADVEFEWVGLGDDPETYVFSESHGRIQVTDPNVDVPRAARDHRELVRASWRAQGEIERVADARLGRLRREVDERRHLSARHAQGVLRGLLVLLADLAPVPAAILLFADGAAGMHHAFHVHQLARRLGERDDARRVLQEVHDRVDQLEVEEAAALVELLLAEYG